MARKKLLVLASTYPRWPGDPEPAFVHELSKRISGAFDVRVICPHEAGAAALEVMDGVEVVRFRYAPARLETLVSGGGIIGNLKQQRWKWILVPFFFLGLLWQAWREIRRWHPDVIHAHWLIPQGVVAAILGLLGRRMPPFLVTSHGADLFALRSSALIALKRYVASRASALTVVSQVMKGELERIGVEPNKISVLSMGVDLRQLFTPASDCTRSKTEILFVGRLVEKKGLKYLIAAMPGVLARCPEAALTIVGFGPEEAARREQAKLLGVSHRVQFVGAMGQAELPAYYRRAAVFVAPFVQANSGDREGLGLVLVEALGCGCPVIVSDMPASRDVTKGMREARTIRTEDFGSLDHVICEILLAEPREPQQMEASLNNLRERFDWSTIARGYIKVLNEVLHRRDHSQ